MLNIIYEIFSYPFMVKAIIVGLLISICSALLGVILVLKRYSMIGDGLSHVGFGALAIATVLNKEPLLICIPVVVIVSFFLLKINENRKIKGDSAIALISTSSLAIGIMVLSISICINTDVSNYLFGSILGLTNKDVILTIILTIVVILVFIIFYNKIFAITFDETFSKATGINANLYNMIIAFLTSLVIVFGMRTMGSLLISSLMIFPTLTSMRVFKSFKQIIINSLVVSIICFLIGVFLSYIYDMPTGASISVVNIVAFLIYYIVGIIKNKL